ncbi:hypothetical protein PRIPAC_91406 [Pristionchus pacificus]|uniref:DUF148 domain-containing protein n=1 Tax=Pristionchus pacificus TaxID=54126 RepID=A0A454XTZ3_PRIPA|nr:hypothetical protein PRIPAC_91406 [Pristionchus pacificus]|eukprot:PDM62234.1 hypothetical protein PRIPAC_51676 [Pristionchus pacificus]
MQLSILLLLSFSAIVLSQAPSKPAPPPFLNGLSNDAKREFGAIASNKKITRLDLRNKVYEWADKYGVRSGVEDYLTKKNKAKADQRARIQAAIDNLPGAYKTLNALGDDDSLTQEDADSKIKQTLAGYTWELKELLRLAGPGNQGRKPGSTPADAA